MLNQRHKIIIGIDTGTHTGFASWDKPERRFLEILTLPIHRAMEKVLEYHRLHGELLFVRFEDARLRKWFGEKTAAELQGAGSIKRDASIWEEFLRDYAIPFAAVAPRNVITKLDPEKFKTITGWKGVTSNHARDAAMLVYGY